jgi:Fe-S cluster assembly protein SufB
MATSNQEIQSVADGQYLYGWATDVEEESAPPGLSEEIVRWISAKKGEPEWLMEWRLRALRHFFKLVEENQNPEWANLKIPSIDLQAISYYAAPKPKLELESLDEVDAEILKPTRSWASRSRSRSASRASPSTPSSTACLSPTPRRSR